MKHLTLREKPSPAIRKICLIIGVWGCSDPRTGPGHLPDQPIARPQVLPEWSVANANVVVTQEVIDETNGRVVSRYPRYRYALTETKESAGWRASVIKLTPQQGDIPEKLQRPPSGRNLARVEFDGAGNIPKAFSLDGNVFPRSTADSSSSATRSRDARHPSWYVAKPRPPIPTRTGVPGRRSLILGLAVQPDSNGALRDALIKRYGTPASVSNGDELFLMRAGDTVRTLGYRPSVGAIASIRVDIAGTLASLTEYEFTSIGDGIVARTQIRTLRGAGRGVEGNRLHVTTVTWSGIRLGN